MKKILIIDDSSIVRQTLKRYTDDFMKSHNLEYDIFEATQGEEGVDVVQNHPDIDLILLDLNMPIMNGEEFIEKVRNDLKIIHPKIIVISAERNQLRVSNIIKKMVNGYILKPFSYEKIVQLLHTHFER